MMEANPLHRNIEFEYPAKTFKEIKKEHDEKMKKQQRQMITQKEEIIRRFLNFSPTTQFTKHTKAVNAVCTSPCGKYLFTGSKDNTAIMSDVASGEHVKVFTKHTSAVNAVCTSPCGKYLFTGSDDNTAIMSDIASGEDVKVFTKHTSAVNAVCTSPCGKYLFTGSGDNLFTGSHDNTAIMWGIASGEHVKVFTKHTRTVYAVCTSPCGKYLFTGSADKTAIMWDIASGEVLKCIGEKNGENLFDFVSEGKSFVTPDGVVYFEMGDHSLLKKSFFIPSMVDFNTRADRSDLILRKVSEELRLLQLKKEETFHSLSSWPHLQLPEENFLVQGGYFSFMKEKGVFIYQNPINYSDLETYMIPVENIAGKDSKFLDMIVHHADVLDNCDVFQNEVVKCVVYFKWNKFVSQYFYMDFKLTLLLCVLYLIHSISFNDYIENDDLMAFGVVAMPVCFLLSCYFLLHELFQIKIAIDNTWKGWADFKETSFLIQSYKAYTRNQPFNHKEALQKDYFYSLYKKYFDDAWNWIHLITNVLIICTLIKQTSLLMSGESKNLETTLWSALTMPFLVAEIVFYMSGLKETGPLVRMIINIIHGIRYLILILAIIVIFFSGSYTILFHDNPQEGYEDFFSCSLSVSQYLYGNYDMEPFEHCDSPALAKALNSLFMFLVVVVILNLLIALMGDLYSDVETNQVAQTTYGVAKLVVEYESLLRNVWWSESYIDQHERDYYPTWLYVLKTRESTESTVEIQQLRAEIAALKENTNLILKLLQK